MADTFDSIIGQEHIREHLRVSVMSGKISQAYLITGESMQGKEFIARIFANALVCENPSGGVDPCGKCRSCIQAATRNNPDIITVTHDKPNTISIDDIREQIISESQIRPYQSRRKIFIMNEAQKMTPQAQNALLKTLEEPPEYVVIMLLATSKAALLPTVLSRCVQLDMRPVADSIVKKYLMNEVKVPDYRADICTAFARGNIGKAKSLATSEDMADLVDTLKKLEKYKINVDEFLDIMMIWYRDVLLYKATMDENSLIFRDEKESIIKEAGNDSYEGIETILRSMDKTKQRIKANVNYELAMELMLLAIKEN